MTEKFDSSLSWQSTIVDSQVSKIVRILCLDLKFEGQYKMREVVQCENWKVSLGTRNNLFYNDIPYVPLLVEHIPIYLSFEDHEENGVKTIQTLGELVPKTETFATLLSLTPGNNTEFPLSFANLNMRDVYIKNLNKTFCATWEKYTVFKVYGILETTESGNILETTHLVPVHDVEGSLNIMTLLVTLARSEYRQYYRTQGQNDMLQSQWDKMKEEEKRLVTEEEDLTTDILEITL